MARLRVSLTLMLASILALFAVGCEPEAPNGKASAPQTSRMQMSRDGSTLYVALADHDQVRAIDAESGDVLGTIDVAGHPHRLTVLADGRVAVTARYGGTLTVANVEQERIEATIEVGSDPFGVVEADGALWVVLAADSELARVDLRDLSRVADRVVLNHPLARGLAVADGGKLLVSHASAGRLSVVDIDAREPRADVDLRLPSRAFFIPTQVESMTISPEGDEVALPHVECNNDPAQFGAGGTDLGGAVQQYYVQGPTGFPAVVPAVSRTDVHGDMLLSDDTYTPEQSSGLAHEPPGRANPIINPLNTMLLGPNFSNGPSAVAFARDGELELVVNKNSGNVLLRRSVVRTGQSSIIGVVNVGVGADAIAVSRDGNTAYVYNAFNDKITVFDIPLLARTTSKYADSSGTGSGAMFVDRAEALVNIEPSATYQVANPILSEDVRRGRELFHSVTPEMTRMGAVACASCHPGGASDGVTWQFAEGPRQSQPLWGGISDSAPFHWDSNVPTFADISTVTIQGRMGGTGLSPATMNLIAAFLDTIPAPAPARFADDAAVERGAALFFAESTECTSCHSGSMFSDGREHNVGTGRDFVNRETEVAIATPNLRGLGASAPYLHDGSAATMDEMVDALVKTDLMGKGSHLTPSELADLVAFLKSL